MNLSRIAIPGTRLAALVAAFAATSWARAANPIVQTRFTADPAPMVYDGVVYLYTSHDEDDAPPGQGRFLMKDWRCYTSTDMVNWTDHGTVASLATFPWAVQENDAWAPQVVERNGKFYLYVPISVPGWPKNVIAVAVADSPLGPFKDALGHPLIDKTTGYIDPTVFVDDDGQAARNKPATSTICHITPPFSNDSLRGLGGRCIVFSSVGSKASAMPSVTAVIMFTHRIWIGEMGRLNPSSSARTTVMASPALVGSVQLMTFLILS